MDYPTALRWARQFQTEGFAEACVIALGKISFAVSVPGVEPYTFRTPAQCECKLESIRKACVQA